MKAEAVIAMVRRDVETMWQKHLNWLATGGQEGIPCLDIPSMERLRNRTDLEILDKALSKGMYIHDSIMYMIYNMIMRNILDSINISSLVLSKRENNTYKIYTKNYYEIYDKSTLICEIDIDNLKNKQKITSLLEIK